MRAEWVGTERVHGRRILLAELRSDWRWPSDVEVEWLTVFVAADAERVDDARIRSFAEETLRRRCAYLSAWGRDYGRVEAIFDDVYASDPRHRHRGRTTEWSHDIPFLMTTSHERDSLAAALWFGLALAWPDTEGLIYGEARRSAIVVLAERRYLADVRAYLEDQERLDRDADDENGGSDARRIP